MKSRRYVAIAWGALIGSMTFMVGDISWPSPNPIVEAIKAVLMVLMIPGLIGGAAISGNIHAFSLGAGALVNALFHFGLSWLLFPLVMRFKRSAKV
jgi:hypothetical protein